MDLRHQWSDDASLEIRNVTRRDAGVYNVKCTNDEGVNQTSITLDVQCKNLHKDSEHARSHMISSGCTCQEFRVSY